MRLLRKMVEGGVRHK